MKARNSGSLRGRIGGRVRLEEAAELSTMWRCTSGRGRLRPWRPSVSQRRMIVFSPEVATIILADEVDVCSVPGYFCAPDVRRPVQACWRAEHSAVTKFLEAVTARDEVRLAVDLDGWVPALAVRRDERADFALRRPLLPAREAGLDGSPS